MGNKPTVPMLNQIALVKEEIKQLKKDMEQLDKHIMRLEQLINEYIGRGT